MCRQTGHEPCWGVEWAAGFNSDPVFDEFLVLFTAISLVPTTLPGTL